MFTSLLKVFKKKTKYPHFFIFDQIDRDMAIFIQLPQKQHVFATPRIWALVDFYFIWGVQYSDFEDQLLL